MWPGAGASVAGKVDCEYTVGAGKGGEEMSPGKWRCVEHCAVEEEDWGSCTAVICDLGTILVHADRAVWEGDIATVLGEDFVWSCGW